MRSLSICRLLVACVIYFASQGGGYARVADAPASPSAVVEPDTISLTAEEANKPVRGVLHIYASGIPSSELTLEARWLTLGKNYAYFKFTRTGTADSVNLGDPKMNCTQSKSCAVEFEVDGVNAQGTYTGSIDVYSPTAKLASATVSVLLAGSSFDVTLTGDSVRNDAVSLDATETRSFAVTISSGAGSPARTYRVELTLAASETPGAFTRWLNHGQGCPGRSAEASIGIEPASFSLDGGAAQPVLLRVPDCLETGIYTGFLKISDAQGGPSISKALTIKKNAAEGSRRLLLLFWVVVGALLSVVLNNAFPLSRARVDRFGELRAIDARIRGMSSIDPELRGSLLSESRRIWLLTDTINFWNSRKSSILNEATQAIEALKKLLDLASSINGLRSEVESAAIPIRTQLAIDAQLCLAEDALVQSDAASAQAPITAAKELLSASPNSNATLAAALTADISRLLRERPNGGDPVPGAGRDAAARMASKEKAIEAGRPPPIAQQVLQLEVDLPTLGAAPWEDLLKIERDYYIADVWTDIVEFAVRADPTKYEGVLGAFLAQLEAAPAAQRTQLLIALYRASIGPGQIEDALRNSEASIVANPLPRFLDLESYAFEFSDPVLNSVPAARALPCYQWEFDDRTIPPDDGDRCKHFFLPEPLWARWVRVISRSGPKRHKVEVTVSIPKLSAEVYKFEKTLQMREPHDHASSLTAMQVITFIITTGTAVLAAFGAQYASSIPTSIDWGVSVTALLFGFGIDQVRDRASSSGGTSS